MTFCDWSELRGDDAIRMDKALKSKYWKQFVAYFEPKVREILRPSEERLGETYFSKLRKVAKKTVKTANKVKKMSVKAASNRVKKTKQAVTGRMKKLGYRVVKLVLAKAFEKFK